MKKVSENIKEFLRGFSLNHVWFMVGLLMIILFVASLLLFYLAPRDNAFVRSVTSKLPYPIVFVDGKIVTERALANNMNSVRRFYENQDFAAAGMRVDFTTDDGKKRLQVREREVLNKMVEDKALENIAQKKGIVISDEEVKEDIKKRIDTYGTGDEVVQNLERLYGWSLKDFAEKTVKPALYEDRLLAVYDAEVSQDVPQQKIEAAEKDLAAKNAFPEVAKKYSEGSTGESGGELGWFQLTDLAPELRDAVKAAPLNAATPILESSLGYHILWVHETKTEDDTTLYRVSQIFVKKITFSEWLTEEMRKQRIYVWSPFYRWNNEAAEVMFASTEWQQLEKMTYENATEDALFSN